MTVEQVRVWNDLMTRGDQATWIDAWDEAQELYWDAVRLSPDQRFRLVAERRYLRACVHREVRRAE